MTINNFTNTHLGTQVFASDLRVGDTLGNGETVTGVRVRNAARRTVWIDTTGGPSRITGRDRKVWIAKR